MAYNLKSIKKHFAKNGIFYTPPELAVFMAGFIDFEPKTVYDPTCGQGSLLSVFEDSVKKYGCDIEQQAIDYCNENLVNFEGYQGDTLSSSFFDGMKFDVIMGNPPFSLEWAGYSDKQYLNNPVAMTKGRADYCFIQHILHHLADDGLAIVLSACGILYRGQREQSMRIWLVEKGFIEKIIHVEGDTFTDTKIATVCLVMRKNRTEEQQQSIEFIDKKTGKSRLVSVDEIAKNDYLLSVNSYLPDEKVAEKVDILAVEAEIARCKVKRRESEDYLDDFIKKTFYGKEI
jgi:type I restriction-modification system DNA methylase subunit